MAAGGGGERRELPLPLIALVMTAAIVFLVYLIAKILVAQGDQVPSPSSLPIPNPVAVGFQPQSIVFLGPDRGFISGSVPCSTCAAALGGLIAATVDGGVTWRITYRGQRPIVGLRHIGGTDVLTATATTCRNAAYIDCAMYPVTSGDLGATWEADPPGNHLWRSPPSRPVPCNPDHPNPVASSFPTPDLGWVLCAWKPTTATYQYKGLYQTRDGGTGRWHELPEFQPMGSTSINPSNMPVAGFAWGIDFLRDGHGWLWTVNAHASLSATDDGGMHWRRIWSAPEAQGGPTLTALSASLADPTLGFLLTWEDGTGSALLRTNDGGTTWIGLERWPMAPAPPIPLPARSA